MPVPRLLRTLCLLGGTLLLVAFGMRSSPPVLVEQPTLADVRRYEANFDSRTAPLPAPSSEAAYDSTELREHCPPARRRDVSTRIHFHRPATTMPPGRIRYFADADSTVHCVSYTWDESHTMTGDEMVERLSRGGVDPDTVVARYDTAFDEIVRSLRKRLGAPDRIDPRPIVDTDGVRKQYRRRAHWSRPHVVIDVALNVSLLGGQIQVDQYWR